MNKKSIYLEIANWLIEWKIYKYSNSMYDYPWKIDSFIALECNSENSVIKFEENIIDKSALEKITPSECLYHDNNEFYPYYIYMINENIYLWVQYDSESNPIVAFKISYDLKLWNLIYDITNSGGKYAFEYCTKFFPYTVLELEGVVLHGVLLEYKDKGIIISAPSGTGKTTHARMWRDTERALIINGDRALCRKIEGKWTGFGMPWCGTSGEYINRDIEISAIVVLEQAKENSVKKLDTLNAFQYMIPNITAPTWEKNLLNKAMDYLEDIVNEVPVYKLKCTPDIGAVEVLKKEIEKL